MDMGLVKKIDINVEMQQAYLDYAMSVIVSRALPDARDGLKPVHRRILYAMYDMGLRANTGFKKSARVVGEVLGKYHPHSDTAVYDAMARLAQDFSMRYPLVEGQGNFGSVDGDPPAAMRYTEARMANPAMNMLIDINKDTVDYSPNFDETLQEPTVLPSALPNLLVNGSSGIAVGMSTSIPPHNVEEVIDASIYMLEKWKKFDNISLEDLMQFIKGPDFPTGGAIIRNPEEDGLIKAYGTGRGRIKVQAIAHIEAMGRSRERIIVTELPYMTNKASLIERIASLTRDGKLEDISDLRDESDRQGMRIVIELARGADARKILRDLYKRTAMQSTFGIIMLALVDNQPVLLTLKHALKVYLDHRIEVIRRRSEFELKKLRARAHILEGYRVALKNLDEIIQLIRSSKDTETAQKKLIKRYKLSDIQAKAILDMPLRRLSALERKKIEIEYKEIMQEVKRLTSLLASPTKIRKVVAQEMLLIKEKYADRRRTQMVSMEKGQKQSVVLTAQDMLPEQEVWVTMTSKGILGRIIDGKKPKIWGSDAAILSTRANTRDTLYLMTQTGKAAAIPVHSLPEVEKSEEGELVSQLSPLKKTDKVTAMFVLPSKEKIKGEWFIFVGTKGGMVKKSAIEELPGVSAQTFSLIKTKGNDQALWTELTNGEQEIFLATAKGQCIRFSEDTVRPMGLIAAGVNGIKLKANDYVIGMEIIDERYEVFMVTSNAQAKRVAISQFPTQGRYGQGVTGWKLEGDARLVGVAIDKPNRELGLERIRRTPKLIRLDDAKSRTRQAKGKDIFDMPLDVEEIICLYHPKEMPHKIC